MHSAYLSLVTEELTLKDLLKAPECRVIFSVVLFAWRLSDWIFFHNCPSFPGGVGMGEPARALGE